MYKFTSIPLSKELLSESIKNDKLEYLVDYSGSSFKKEQLFAYLNNLKLKYEIYFNNDISYEDFEDLIKTYLNTDMLITSNVLTQFVGHIILKYLDSDSPFNIFISDDYINKFIENNKELLDRWILFLDSTIVFMERKNGIENDHPVIDDINYVGLNIVSLYLSEHFLVFYNEIEREKNKPVFFIQHYQLPLFFGSGIFQYIDNYWNPLARLPTMAITGFRY